MESKPRRAIKPSKKNSNNTSVGDFLKAATPKQLKTQSRFFWLMKTEPDTFSIEDLKNSPKKTTFWEGVRNYQARNFLRSMKKGDLAFFYHSSCPIPAIVGIVEITQEAYPDKSAFNPQSPYFDVKSAPDNPRWWGVDVKFKYQFENPITLASLKQNPKLGAMPLLQKGNRLSVMRLTVDQWENILSLYL